MSMSASLTLPSTSLAAENGTPNVWETRQIRLSYMGNGHSDRRKAKIDTGEVLFTTSETEIGIYFSCIAGSLRAGLTFKPQNIREAFRKQTMSGVSSGGSFVPTGRSLSYVDMTLNGGEKIGLGRWHYSKEKQTAYSRKRKPAAKLYNALVRKQVIAVETKSKDPVTIVVPKFNAAFADFGAECGIGRLKYKPS